MDKTFVSFEDYCLIIYNYHNYHQSLKVILSLDLVFKKFKMKGLAKNFHLKSPKEPQHGHVN